MQTLNQYLQVRVSPASYGAAGEKFSQGSTLEFTWWLRSLLGFTQEEWKLSTSLQDTLRFLCYRLQWVYPTAARAQVQRKLDKRPLRSGAQTWRVIFHRALGSKKKKNQNNNNSITITEQQWPSCPSWSGRLKKIGAEFVSCSSSTHHTFGESVLSCKWAADVASNKGNGFWWWKVGEPAWISHCTRLSVACTICDITRF